MTKQTTYDPYVPVDIFGHVSFIDRVAQIREKNGPDNPKSREQITELTKPLDNSCCWFTCTHENCHIIAISAHLSKCRKTARFEIIDNKAVLTDKGEYKYEGQLDKVEAVLTKFFSGNFNELVLETDKAVADSKAMESLAVKSLLDTSKSLAELYTTRFLLRHGVVDVIGLDAKIKANPAYLGRIIGEVMWENQRSRSSLALRNGIKSAVYPFPVEAPAVDDPSVRLLLSELEVMRSLYAKKAAKDVAQKAEYSVTTNFEI